MSEVLDDIGIFQAIVEDDIPVLIKNIGEGFTNDVNDGGWSPLMEAVDQSNMKLANYSFKLALI